MIPPAHSTPFTLRVPGDFPTIQDAINAANPGDTILVSEGTYFESLTIKKALNLTGVSRDTTIIDTQENGPGINITGTSGVFVSGFTVKGTGFFYDGIDVVSSDRTTIAGNIVEASEQTSGMVLLNSSSVTVRDNIITGNDVGIRVHGGFANVFRRNNITLSNVALGIEDGRGNEVKDNILGLGASGLQLIRATGNVLSRNRLFNNTGTAVFLWNSTGNTVLENNVEFSRGTFSSIGIRLQNSTGNQFYYNNIRNNTIQVFGVLSADVSQNTWNDGGAGKRGNFWSDYVGVDDGSNGRVQGDGIGDTLIPHPCPNGERQCSSSLQPGVDYYPLTSPWQAPALSVEASADTTSGYPPLTVHFTSVASGGLPPYNFSWTFGTGAGAGQQNASYTYQSPGNYVATVTATDDQSNTRSDLVPVTVLVVPSPPAKPADILPLVLAAVALVAATVIASLLFWRRRTRRASVKSWRG